MSNYQMSDQDRKYSWEEYLKLEAESELKFEYHDGEIVCMAGGTNRHNEIAISCISNIRKHALKKGCKTYGSDVKLFRYQNNKYYYPDVLVSCNPLDLQTQNGIRNPLIVAEVLSKTTSERDRGIKLKEYLRLPSLRHYLLIEQTHCEVQHFLRREDGHWEVQFYDQITDKIELPELDYSLSLADLYEGVAFGPEPDILEEEEIQYELD